PRYHPIPRGPRPGGRPALFVVRAGQAARRAAAGADPGDAHRPRSGAPEALGERLQTFLPATHVSSTCVRASDWASTAVGSRSTMTKSAHLPGSRAPILSSANPAYAAPRV